MLYRQIFFFFLPGEAGVGGEVVYVQEHPELARVPSEETQGSKSPSPS